MTDPTQWPAIGQLASLLGISSGIMLAAVKFMLNTHGTAVGGRVDRLREHIDSQISGLGERLDQQEEKIQGHSQQLHNQELALLKQRNEMLESLRDRSVSREEFSQMVKQIDNIDRRLNGGAQ